MNEIVMFTIPITTFVIGFTMTAFFIMSDTYLDGHYKKYRFTTKGFIITAILLLPFIHGILIFLILVFSPDYFPIKIDIKKLLFKEKNK